MDLSEVLPQPARGEITPAVLDAESVLGKGLGREVRR